MGWDVTVAIQANTTVLALSRLDGMGCLCGGRRYACGMRGRGP